MADTLQEAPPTRSTTGRQSGPFPTAAARRRYWLIVAALGVLTVLVCYGTLAWANPMPLGSVGFWRIAELRATNLIVIIVVAFCQAIGTIAFQTATTNRILTPSIMGFESLYRAVQTAVAFSFGATGMILLQGVWQYLLQIVLMVGFAAGLYGWLLTGRYANLQIMLLVGIILGGGLGAVATFLQRMLSPTVFDLLTARLIGSIANADATYLAIAIPLAAVSGGLLWVGSRRLDVMALGRQAAINLGLNHSRLMIVVLLLVSVLIAVSTSLVGPMTFFGFLVAMLTYQIAETHDHRYLFAVGWLTGIVVLGGGYFVLRNIFYAQGAVGVIIEIVGGTFFLIYLLRKGRL